MTSLKPIGTQGSTSAFLGLYFLLKRHTRPVSTTRTHHLHAVPTHGTEFIHWSSGFDMDDPVTMATGEGVRLESPSR